MGFERSFTTKGTPPPPGGDVDQTTLSAVQRGVSLVQAEISSGVGAQIGGEEAPASGDTDDGGVVSEGDMTETGDTTVPTRDAAVGTPDEEGSTAARETAAAVFGLSTGGWFIIILLVIVAAGLFLFSRRYRRG